MFPRGRHPYRHMDAPPGCPWVTSLRGIDRGFRSAMRFLGDLLTL